MTSMTAFHDVRFPTDIALGAAGGPERRTEIVTLGSGREQRNSRWANSRRKYNAGYGVKTLDDLADIIAFFEARRGRLHGFRFKDPLDYKSSKPRADVLPTDQLIGTGDGATATYQLVKAYGTGESTWTRKITKPIENSVAILVEGVLKTEGVDYTINYLTGEIDFSIGTIPGQDEQVFAGFEFDVPVRFDIDEITVSMTNFVAGEITSIPLVEILT